MQPLSAPPRDISSTQVLLAYLADVYRYISYRHKNGVSQTLDVTVPGPGTVTITIENGIITNIT